MRRVGIVGAGLQARRRAPVISEDPRAELMVISAEHMDASRALASRFGCEAAEGWEPVIERSDLDVVLVCTPPHLHARITLAALARGMHVLCEKPLARTVEEADQMVAAAQQNERILKCGFNHRHHPGVQLAKRWLDGGEIGEPLCIRAHYGIGGRPGYETEWRADPQVVGGGQLMEQGIHLVDLARWFLGDFAKVTAVVRTLYWPIAPLEDNAFVVYETGSGQLASIHSSLTQWTNAFRLDVFGREGWVSVAGLGGGYGTESAILSRRDFGAPFSEHVVEFRGEDRSWRGEWDEFIGAIEGRRELSDDGADGLAAIRLVYAAYASSTNGQTVFLS